MTDDVGELIARTLENAARAPFYARTWGDRWKGIKTIADMAKLPLLDKETAIKHQRELVVGDAPAGFGSSADLAVLRSADEQALLAGDPKAPANHPGWTLVVVNVRHDSPARPPARGELHVPWTVHPDALTMIEASLEKPQPDGQRVTSMHISADALKTVTLWFLEQKRDLKSFGVKKISTHGSRLSAHWRDLVAEAWGAQLYDTFTLARPPLPPPNAKRAARCILPGRRCCTRCST